MSDRANDGLHVTSLAHDGRLWTAYLEFDDDPHDPQSYRARLRFEPAAPGDASGPARTAVIIIEESYEGAMAKARSFDERQLSALLRSALPEEGGTPAPDGPTSEDPGEDGP